MLIKKKIELNKDFQISYLDNDEIGKKIIVFIHGWGADKYNLQSIFNPLIKDFRIISIDLPGFGESTMPSKVIGSLDYADLLIDFFKRLNVKKINYVGHSLGGKIGIVLSARYPELISRLVLIDSSGLRSRRGISWHVNVGIYKFLKFLYSGLIKDQVRLEKLKNRFGSADYRQSGNMRNILVKLVNEDFSHMLERINCPVFLYWGSNDKDTPLWMAKKLKRNIKDCEMFVVKNGGHFSFLDDNRIIYIIKSFVS